MKVPIVLCSLLLLLIPVGLLSLAEADMLSSLLTRQSGQSAATIIELLPGLLRTAAVVLLALCAICVFAGRRLEAMACRLFAAKTMDDTTSSSAPALTWRAAAGWLLIVVALVLLFDGSAILSGYFESDDYALLTADREYSLPTLLTQTHNDHTIPLLRLEVRAMRHLAGVNAIGYNVIVLISFSALLFAGCVLLLESGLSRISIAVYLGLSIGWTLWAHFTTGEYILQKYMQITTLGILTMWTTIRWSRTQRFAYVVVVLVAVASACFMNISGFWVPCAFFVVLTCQYLEQRVSKSEPVSRKNVALPIAACLIPVAAAIAFNVYAFSLPDNSEFMQQRGGGDGVTGLAWQLWYYISSLILSIPIPVPHHLTDFGMLFPAMVVSCLMVCGLVVYAWRSLGDPARWHLLAACFILAGIGTMICLGRPESSYGFFMAPKYAGPGYVWLCLILAYVTEAIWRRAGEGTRPALMKVLLLGVAVMWASHGTASWLGQSGMGFFGATRGGEYYEDTRERLAVEALRRDLFLPLEEAIAGEIVIPDLEGPALCAVYPSLDFTWGLQPPMSWYIDVLATDPDRMRLVPPNEITHQIVSRACAGGSHLPESQLDSSMGTVSLSPEFLRLLEESAAVRQLYCQPMP